VKEQNEIYVYIVTICHVFKYIEELPEVAVVGSQEQLQINVTA